MSQLNCEVRAEGHLSLNPCQTIAHSSDEIITKAKYLEEEAKRRVNQQDNQDSQDAEDINNDDEDNSSDGGSSNSRPTGTNNAQASVQGNEETDDEDKSLSLGDDDESKEDDVFYENSIAAGDKQQQQQQLSQPAAGPSVIQQDDDEELEWVHLEKNCYRTVYCDPSSFLYLSSSPNFLGVFLKIYFALCTLFECLTFVSIFLCLPLSGILHFIKQIRVHKKGLIVLAMRDRGSPLASGPPVLRTSSDFHGRHANNKLFYRV